MHKFGIIALLVGLLAACGTLEKKSVLLDVGDSKERVIEVMGLPQDRQLQGRQQAWQYCVTGAGFGYHDYRVIWFNDARVSGITSYKDTTPASGCTAHFKTVRWEEAPDLVIQTRD